MGTTTYRGIAAPPPPDSSNVIATAVPELVLAPLSAADAGEYDDLILINELRLGSDYASDVALTLVQRAAEFAGNPRPPLMFGIRLDGALVGRVDLVAVAPPRYGLGYWLSAEVVGRGYATASVRAVTSYAATVLGATDILAGVSHGNDRSIAVLARCGFSRVEQFETYDRYQRSVVDEP